MALLDRRMILLLSLPSRSTERLKAQRIRAAKSYEQVTFKFHTLNQQRPFYLIQTVLILTNSWIPWLLNSLP